MLVRAAAVAAAVVTAGLLAACSSASGAPTAPNGGIVAVGAENEYANVIAQIGGKYVHVTAILSNPSTDPHTFESSPSVSQTVGAARLVVQNGLGYDAWMNKIEAATPNSERKVIDVQKLLHLPDSTPNPHLWYSPATMPAVAKAIATDLAALLPAHAAVFKANLARFNASLRPWYQAMAHFKAAYPGTPVATTEPVGGYMLQAAGARNLTPPSFQQDIMNGIDPSPQNVSAQTSLFTGHKVKAFLYNRQVTSSLTQSFLDLARKNGIPVVALYETMPTPGYTYQSWMLAEVRALQRAVAGKVTTSGL
ncbi:MAG: zinc ABC transporter substrate-binding protein [Actinobacteria bacterium]|nr:zinc ABC transporter substrate-binding protein [Actinomycetota bacterium]